MADEEIQIPPDITGPAEARPAAQKRVTRVKSAKAEKLGAASSKQAKPKTRGLSDQDKLERIGQIEAQLSGGATLKDAVKIAGISDQTYYQWKKAASRPVTQASDISGSVYDEFADFDQLEEENRRLRKLLAEKLRAENANLRKRLGMS